MKDGKLQWHPAFGAVLRIELEEELDKLQIEEEHLLSKKPMQVDYLIVKLRENQQIRKNIGQLFRKHNIVEYKGPEDCLSINDFYKVYGYACFYQSDTDKVMEISPEEIGITFVCNHYPRKMLKHIQRVRGITVKKREEGIYELSGDPIPMQMIITHQLTKEKNLWMQSLRSDLKSGGEIGRLIEAYDKKKNQAMYQAVMEVIIQANQKEAEAEREMCEALRKLFEEDFIDAEKRGESKGIKALVESGYAWKHSVKEVMDMLIEKYDISQADAENYIKAYYK